jgi:glyoxylase I family protein
VCNRWDMDDAARAKIRDEQVTAGVASSGLGVHHVALICSDVQRTIDFYAGFLGFPLVEIFENRDYKDSCHLFFDIGGDNRLAFFDFPGYEHPLNGEVLGGLQHIAISVDDATFARLKEKIDAAGIDYLGPDRGVEGSMYLRGPDGEGIELLRAPLGSMQGTAPSP